MTDAPLLEVDGIDVVYGKARAVNGASLRVAPGSITAIVGPNGAGKTSLLKAVSGLQPIGAGRITFAGGRIDGRSSLEQWRAAQGIDALALQHQPDNRQRC